MAQTTQPATSAHPQQRDTRPMLLFFQDAHSGPCRRMASLVAWVRVNEKHRLAVVDVDIDVHPQIARRLSVNEVPTLVLVKDGRVVGRLEGKATGRDIDRLISPHIRP